MRLHYMRLRRARATRRDSTSPRSRRRSSAATRSWVDDLEEALVEEHGEERGNALLPPLRRRLPRRLPRRLGGALGGGRHRSASRASASDDLALSLYRPLEAPAGALRAKLFRSGAPLALSDMLPMFENMGVQVADERPYEITPRDGASRSGSTTSA